MAIYTIVDMFSMMLTCLVCCSPYIHTLIVPEQELQLAEEREEEMADAVTLFSKKMKDLERGVRRGDLDIAELVKESENSQSAMDRGAMLLMYINTSSYPHITPCIKFNTHLYTFYFSHVDGRWWDVVKWTYITR